MNANGAQVVRFFNLNIFDSLYRNANFLPVNSSIRHLHISVNTPSFPLKLFHNGFFYFSWLFEVEPSELEDNSFANKDGGRMPSL